MIVSDSFLNRGIDTMVTLSPMCIQQDTKLDELLERLYATGHRHWPVVDSDQHLIGMVSDHDIVESAAEREAACEVFHMPSANLNVNVSDFMRSPVITVDMNDSTQAALELFLKHEFHSLPVTQDDTLAGMITTTDLLREFAYSFHPAKDMEVTTLYDADPFVLDAATTLDDIRIDFITNEVTYGLVRQGDEFVGAISERDVRQQKCRAMTRMLYEKASSRMPTAVDMIGKDQVVPPTAHLGEVALIMHDTKATAVMVSATKESPAGVISLRKVMSVLAEYDAND